MAGINVDLGGLLGGIGAAAKDIRQAVTGEISAEKKAELALKVQELESSALLAQAEINKAEASSPRLFVAGWRPFIGWICGLSLGYEFLLKPITEGVTKLVERIPDITLPGSDLSQLLPLVIAMLGLGAYRTVEKLSSVQGKH